MSERLDPRVNAMRTDLADIALMGKVESARFIAGETMRVAAPTAPIRHAPSHSATLVTEGISGELVTVFETRPDGWMWIQLQTDRYVGWAPTVAMADPGRDPTHKVSALRTVVFVEPDIKSPPLASLPLGARISAIGESEDRNARYALIAPKGAVVVQHLAALDAFETDWTSVAERFLEVPYLWGGKTSLGIDCSGLSQIALQTCGIAAPRDTDMQERALGVSLPLDRGLPALRRGDLIFWKGHVGIMRDAETLIHANAHYMAVASEPLAEVTARFAERPGPIRAVRRLA